MRFKGQDGNLLYEIEWASFSPDAPQDLIARFYELAGALLLLCRVPEAGPPSTLTASPAPMLPGPPVLPYRAVDDLCQVIDFASLGPVAPGTVPSHTSPISSISTGLQCSAELSGPLGVGVQATVYKDLETAARQLGLRQANFAQAVPYLWGSGAFVSVAPGGQVEFGTYDLNLYVEISLVAGDQRLPDDIDDRLAQVAASVVAGLRTQS